MVKWEQLISSGVIKSVSKVKKKECVVNDGWREKEKKYHYYIHFYGPHSTVIYAPGVKIYWNNHLLK